VSELIDDRPADTGAPPPEAGGRSLGAWWWFDLRPLLLRLHFYAGLLVGPFILVAATTGLLYTITPQLDLLIHRDALRTSIGTTPLPLADQVTAAAAAVPDGTVTEIRPPREPDGTTRVSFDAPGLRPDFSRTAFVDPFTGQVRAVLDTYGEWLPVRAWIDELHRNLHLGDVGRLYSELAASWLWVLALSGLGAWLVRRRRRARVRRTLLPEGSATGRSRLLSWHGAVGLWAAVGMLFLSVTGLTWSNFGGGNIGDLRSALDWTTPSVKQELPAVAGAAPITDPATLGATADRVLAAARAAGLSGPVEIVPGETGQAWRAAQVQRSWPTQQDAMAVDPSTGAVLDTVRFADWPLAAKLARWGVDAHMGLLFGWFSQLALAALACAIICMVVWGYRMWWLRRPTRPGARAPVGARRPGAAAVGLVGVVAIAAGVLFPALGVSLLVFLAVDAARQHRRPSDLTGQERPT
jgi:uncharacterized iron-regulated membrane protein